MRSEEVVHGLKFSFLGLGLFCLSMVLCFVFCEEGMEGYE